MRFLNIKVLQMLNQVVDLKLRIVGLVPRVSHVTGIFTQLWGDNAIDVPPTQTTAPGACVYCVTLQRVWFNEALLDATGEGSVCDGSAAGSARCRWVRCVSLGFDPLLCYWRMLWSWSHNCRRGQLLKNNVINQSINRSVGRSVGHQPTNQPTNHLLAIITSGKKHREYNQYKWQVRPGRNCAYSWPWNTNKSITILQQWIIN